MLGGETGEPPDVPPGQENPRKAEKFVQAVILQFINCQNLTIPDSFKLPFPVLLSKFPRLFIFVNTVFKHNLRCLYLTTISL